jgi:YVTN family beta-propeller protein
MKVVIHHSTRTCQSTCTNCDAEPKTNTVQVIDGATNSVIKTTGVGAAPTGVGVNPRTNTIYVANRDLTTVSVIDGATNTVTATVGVGSSPIAVGANPSTNRIYVTNDHSSTVSVIQR